jgi:hypothetical protein
LIDGITFASKGVTYYAPDLSHQFVDTEAEFRLIKKKIIGDEPFLVKSGLLPNANLLGNITTFALFRDFGAFHDGAHDAKSAGIVSHAGFHDVAVGRSSQWRAGVENATAHDSPIVLALVIARRSERIGGGVILVRSFGVVVIIFETGGAVVTPLPQASDRVEQAEFVGKPPACGG